MPVLAPVCTTTAAVSAQSSQSERDGRERRILRRATLSEGDRHHSRLRGLHEPPGHGAAYARGLPPSGAQRLLAYRPAVDDIRDIMAILAALLIILPRP